MYAQEVQPYLDNYYNTLEKSKIRDLIQHATDGGKCIRGFIVKHIIETLTGKKGEDISWQPIAGVELIHSASIVIDDLPCMDNDSFRRGKLSTFKQFGKNEAILSSYYMISETLRIIIDGLDEQGSLSCLKATMKHWCDLLGKNLVIGQFLDLKGDAEEFFNLKLKQTDSVNEYIIKYKTCSLFSFTFLLGAFFSNKTEDEDIKDFKDMGQHFGMMFQIMDDYRDRETDVPYANYVLSKGMSQAILKYKESRESLTELLEKHNLLTEKFELLIKNIDKLFAP